MDNPLDSADDERDGRRQPGSAERRQPGSAERRAQKRELGDRTSSAALLKLFDGCLYYMLARETGTIRGLSGGVFFSLLK